MEEAQSLYSVAQIAVTVAGFASLVVVLKRRDDGMWDAGDADRFHGMLLHASFAVGFCFLPIVLSAFVEDPHRLWSVCSLFLGAQLFWHTLMIARLESSKTYTRLGALPGFLAAILQVFNAFGGDGRAEFPLYLIGILWHTFQAAMLFVLLIWIRSDQRS